MKYKTLALIIPMALLIACGSDTRTKNAIRAGEFEDVLDQTGDDYEVVKSTTSVEGFAVYRNERTGEFIAFNLERLESLQANELQNILDNGTSGVDFVRNLSAREEIRNVNERSYNPHESVIRSGTFYNLECECMLTADYQAAWVPQGSGSSLADAVARGTFGYVETFYMNGDFRFSNNKDQSKDLETLAFLQEEEGREMVKDVLKTDFSLSASRADELSKTLARYQKISSIRELSSGERDQMSLEALGIEKVSTIEKSLAEKAKGNNEPYEALLIKAAKINGTTPENVDRFFETFLN